MKKDNSKPAANDSATPELAKSAEPQVGQLMQPTHAERAELPEAIGEGDAAQGHVGVADEYREAAKLLSRPETTEQTLVAMAQREGKSADDVMSDYLNSQLPRHDFYDQPVLLGDAA